MIWDKIVVKYFRDEIDLSNIQYVDFLDDYQRVMIDDLEDEIETLEDKKEELLEEECKRLDRVIINE
tara:strand:- start:49 stop:249 length:201 start_codon:yes stop_codon:yes gene_type:complete